jgi:serine/threonine-protein kinase
VRVAGGEFVRGGDREALWPEDKVTVTEREFWISRGEVTFGEWFAFVNEIYPDGDTGGEERLLPRYIDPDVEHASGSETAILLTQRNPRTGLLEPKYWTDPLTPVVGVSMTDIEAFLEWRNAKARQNGEPWEYDLPTWSQWEKAARGVDQRAYPWGDRFDFTFCKSFYAHPEKVRTANTLLILERGLSYPTDESPYGVRDLAGSVVEWNQDEFQQQQSIRGGAFDVKGPDLFRAASRDSFKADMPSHNLGFRLTARRVK